MPRQPKEELPPLLVAFCTRCGMPYATDPFPEKGCPACGNPEFSWTAGVLTDGWRKFASGTLYDTGG